MGKSNFELDEAKKLIRKQIQYSNEPIDDFKIITDFLPSSLELTLKNKNIKIVIDSQIII